MWEIVDYESWEIVDTPGRCEFNDKDEYSQYLYHEIHSNKQNSQHNSSFIKTWKSNVLYPLENEFMNKNFLSNLEAYNYSKLPNHYICETISSRISNSSESITDFDHDEDEFDSDNPSIHYSPADSDINCQANNNFGSKYNEQAFGVCEEFYECKSESSEDFDQN